MSSGVKHEVPAETLNSISTPDRVDSRLGPLDYEDGFPSSATSELVYDHLDFVHAVNVFLNGFAGASTYALSRGFHEAGAKDNEVLMFSELMDSESLFLTANADTVYFIGIIDLTSGPMVVETPPQSLGIFDDMWWRWIIDFGLPGPDRGEGGRFLLVGPDYAGPLPDSGFHIGRSPTTKAFMLGRAFINENLGMDPAPTVETIKRTTRIYPYAPGSFGTSIATLLEGKLRSGPPVEIPETVFVEASGRAFNTIPPNDIGFYELLNELVQEQPAGSTEIELTGELAAIGIVKGKPFAPDDRMRRILEDGAAVGTATSRALLFDPRTSEGFTYYDGSAWENQMWVGGYDFETPPPRVTEDGIVPFPPTGVRALHSRVAWFYGYTGVTPAMCMRLTGVGSQYIFAFKDADGRRLDGAQTYRVTLPPGIPAARFWSLTAYDTETRSMLQTPQRIPRAGSQSYPTPAATAAADGSTTVVFAPERPAGIPEGNWIQTAEGKGWFPILRLYSPLQSFFDKTWRPSEIEAVKVQP
jgi:hypothetical protein